MDYFKVCRACLGSGTEFTDLKHEPKIVELFWVLANIKVQPINDHMPPVICHTCHQKFIDFNEFRLRIINVNEILLKRSFSNCIQRSETNRTKHSESYKNSNLDEFNTENPSADDETKSIKGEVEIKEETEDYPQAEVFETHFIESLSDIVEKSKFKKENVKIKKCKNKTSQLSTKTPRKCIALDPDKITVIELSIVQQKEIQKQEGLKPAYLAMPYRCDRCYKGFNFERKLTAHVENFHKPNSAYTCNICSRSMRNAASLAIHLKKHKFVYQCNLCLLRLVEKPRAISHYKSCHEGIEEQLPCTHCDKMFRNRSSLNGHIRSHHPNSSRPQCDQCHKMFATEDSLRDHQLIHTGERNYPCPLCDKRFRLKQSVAVHMTSHSSSRTFCCIQCNVSFKSKAALVYHTRTTTSHVPPELRKSNSCSVCGRTFTTATRLRVHRDRHTDRRARNRGVPQLKYICQCCGERFYARRSLERHLKTHFEDGSCVNRPHNMRKKKFYESYESLIFYRI